MGTMNDMKQPTSSRSQAIILVVMDAAGETVSMISVTSLST